MKNQLKIYPNTNPYIALTKSKVYHLNQQQYNAILGKMTKGAGTAVITYRDPERQESRKIPINLYEVQAMDKAEVIQQDHWKKQGGYVCKNGRLVDSQEDCRPRYLPEQPSVYAQAMTDPSKIKNLSPTFREAYEQEIKKIKNYYKIIHDNIRKIGTVRMKNKWQKSKKNWYYLYQINNHQDFHAVCADIGEKSFFCKVCNAKKIHVVV